jgi:hypothetical protein
MNAAHNRSNKTKGSGGYYGEFSTVDALKLGRYKAEFTPVFFVSLKFSTICETCLIPNTTQHRYGRYIAQVLGYCV